LGISIHGRIASFFLLIVIGPAGTAAATLPLMIASIANPQRHAARGMNVDNKKASARFRADAFTKQVMLQAA